MWLWICGVLNLYGLSFLIVIVELVLIRVGNVCVFVDMVVLFLFFDRVVGGVFLVVKLNIKFLGWLRSVVWLVVVDMESSLVISFVFLFCVLIGIILGIVVLMLIFGFVMLLFVGVGVVVVRFVVLMRMLRVL